MLKEKTRIRVYIALLVAVVIGIAALVIWKTGDKPAPAAPAVTPRPTPAVVVKEKTVEKLVEVEKEITAETIRDGLREMGLLVTEEYYFTEVVSFSSIKSLFQVELGITASSFLASYDGVVTAGLDFSGIEVEKDDVRAMITVKMPPARVLNVDIDPESFELYSEKTGLGNPISVEDFNNSLVGLEQTATAKALERGLLEKADANARRVMETFIAGLADPGRYTVRFVTE